MVTPRYEKNVWKKMKMRFIDFQTLTAFECVRLFCHLIASELDFRKENRLDCSYLELKYQNKLFSGTGKEIPVAVWGYAERLIPLIKELKHITDKVRVLDVGCGCGSEALLLSVLGAEVVGTDVVPYRVDFARSRIPYFQLFSKNVSKIQFVNSDVFKYLESPKRFHIIWLIEAISHVHPAEKFLKLAIKSLYDNGLLIISDSNALNPVSCYRSSCIRGSLRWYARKESYKPVQVGEVEVANERIFSVFSLKDKLKSAGFEIKHIEITGFMGSYVLPKRLIEKQRVSNILISFQNTIKRIPILRFFGSNYTIVAKRKADSSPS